MTLKDMIETAAAKPTTQVRRIYADISIEADQALEMLSTMTKKTKKAFLEVLINNAKAEYDAMEKETAKRAKKAKK